MSDPAKIRFRILQLHLSTAIGIMIFAGAFLGANLTEGFDLHTFGEPLSNSAEREQLFGQLQRQEFAESYGWPYVACTRQFQHRYWEGSVHSFWHFELGGMVADLAVALSTIVIFGVVSEYLIPRRAETTQ